MISSYIPFHCPTIGEAEMSEVLDTLRSGWLTTGPRTEQFEKDFRAYVRAKHALAVNSCTAGLHLALVALGLKAGDEVITTPLTFCATVNTILHTGATPVLADVDEDGNIDPTCIERRITPRTRALLPVHYGGLPCDMGAIWQLARRHGLLVIEDAAHAAGSSYEGRPIGSSSGECGVSDAVAFSFYATKNMTTGEGGMVVTPHASVAHQMKLLCLHGISHNAWDRYTEQGSWHYEVQQCGFKYNLSDLQSAIGIHQLRKLEEFISLRRLYADTYRRAWQDVEELSLPREVPGRRNAWHLYPLRLNLDRLRINRAEFISELRALNIGTSVHFIPIPLHPFFAPHRNRPENQCPRALALYPRLVSVPLYPGMSMEEVKYVAESVKGLIAQSRKTRSFAAAGASL